MADITKITTSMMPRENMGAHRPLTEQAFEVNDPTRVIKTENDRKLMDNDGGRTLRDMLGRAAMAPLLREGTETVRQLYRLVGMIEMGISTSEVVGMDPIRNLLESIFVNPDQLAGLLLEQEEAATLFKGESFEILRDILTKFDGNPNVKQSIANLLKTFEFNVNLENSIKTILHQCENLLDYLFSQDRAQFGDYLDNLASMLLRGQEQADQTGRQLGASQYEGLQLGVAPREAAAMLKNNLLPLLGEIVVKYYQSESIRDMVMVVVHNLVRVDKGTPEALRDSVAELVDILSRLANLHQNFEANLNEALARSASQAKFAENAVIEKLAAIIADTLRRSGENPNTLRQAEYLLMSMLQNQSSMMNLLHFMLPLNLPGEGRVYAEMYVDPDSEEARRGKGEENGKKIFIAAQSERHGTVEICFWENNERVELSMWCPQVLLNPLKGMRRALADVMLFHGYTLSSFNVEELNKPHSIIQIFPKLLERKVGIDVKI